MDSKYLIIGGIVFLVIVIAGFGFYMFNQSKSPSTLGVQAKSIHLNPSEFQNALGSDEYELLDIRTSQEFASGHISGAKQSDFYQTQAFSEFLDSLDKSKKYLIYCRSGNRSGQALNIMKEKGFSNVSDLAGGIGAWTGAGLPVEK